MRFIDDDERGLELGQHFRDTRDPQTVFFSSRRRHTRCLSDRSSDVCSSDLSVFVVFRGPASEQAATVPPRRETPLATLEGPWELRLARDLGAPEKVTLPHLASWTENADSGVKYYSGTAAYTKTIDVPAAWTEKGQRITLDLGDVRDLAEVRSEE